jgi:two-component system OmpR family sensor kinase
VRLEPVDILAVVRRAAATSTVTGMHVGVDCDLDGGDRGLTVLADPFRLQQVLDNLIRNAWLHGRAETVVVRVAATEQHVLVSVVDDGVGVAHAEQARIFEPQVRLRSDAPGSGLGLAIARAIVDAHDGELTVASTPGQGASFTICLPRPTR